MRLRAWRITKSNINAAKTPINWAKNALTS